jgi:hypothetical protein
VVIPSKAKNQFMRPSTSNGRKCVFVLDAVTTPKFNASDIPSALPVASADKPPGMGMGMDPMAAEGGDGMAGVDKRIRWVEGAPQAVYGVCLCAGVWGSCLLRGLAM